MPIETHEGSTRDVDEARVFSPDQHSASPRSRRQRTAPFAGYHGIYQSENGPGVRTHRATRIVVEDDIHEIVDGAPERIVAVPASAMNQPRG